MRCRQAIKPTTVASRTHSSPPVSETLGGGCRQRGGVTSFAHSSNPVTVIDMLLPAMRHCYYYVPESGRQYIATSLYVIVLCEVGRGSESSSARVRSSSSSFSSDYYSSYSSSNYPPLATPLFCFRFRVPSDRFHWELCHTGRIERWGSYLTLAQVFSRVVAAALKHM